MSRNNIPCISFIVPVYNRERTIEISVESIIKQKFQDFEILLIDDGSQDSSAKICKNLEETDSRIRYIYKENGGASYARNVGIDNATGEWLAFIDSDDVILPEHSDIVEKEANKADLLMVGMCNGDIEGKKVIPRIIKQNVRIEKANASHYFMSDEFAPFEDGFFNTCNKFYRSSIVKEYNIRFDESMSLGEDQVFTVQYLHHADRLVRYTHNTYIILIWPGLQHLTGKLRKPEDYLYNQRRSYEELLLWSKIKGGDLTEQYAINFGIDRPITRILLPYTRPQNKNFISKADLKLFIEKDLIPFLKTIDTSCYHARNPRVRHIYTILLRYGAETAILWCNALNFWLPLERKMKDCLRPMYKKVVKRTK